MRNVGLAILYTGSSLSSSVALCLCVSVGVLPTTETGGPAGLPQGSVCQTALPVSGGFTAQQPLLPAGQLSCQLFVFLMYMYMHMHSGMVCVTGGVWSTEGEARDGGGGETAAECHEGTRRFAESADKAAVTTIGGGQETPHTSRQLHTLTPSHPHIFTLSHHHTLTPSHLHTLTSSHSHTITLSFTPSHSPPSSGDASFFISSDQDFYSGI